MAFSDQRGTNWGCIAAFVVLMLIGFPILVLVLMTGGGCEGVPPPCKSGGDAPIWITFGGLILLGSGVTWGVNKAIEAWRSRHPR